MQCPLKPEFDIIQKKIAIKELNGLNVSGEKEKQKELILSLAENLPGKEQLRKKHERDRAVLRLAIPDLSSSPKEAVHQLAEYIYRLTSQCASLARIKDHEKMLPVMEAMSYAGIILSGQASKLTGNRRYEPTDNRIRPEIPYGQKEIKNLSEDLDEWLSLTGRCLASYDKVKDTEDPCLIHEACYNIIFALQETGIFTEYIRKKQKI